MVRDTPPYGHAPTYQISLTHLERQKSYGPDKLRWEEVEEEAEAEEEEKIRLKQYVFLRSKGRHNNNYMILELQISIKNIFNKPCQKLYMAIEEMFILKGDHKTTILFNTVGSEKIEICKAYKLWPRWTQESFKCKK